MRELWPELTARIHETFDARDHIDACAHVRLTTTDAFIRVEVILPDGRAASRSVWWRDVVPALEGLLLVPEGGAPGEASDPSAGAPSAPQTVPRTSAVAPAPGADPAVRNRAGLAASTQPERSRVRIEASVVSGARTGDGQVGVGLGVLSFLDVGGWLFGFQGRADFYRAIGIGPPSIALELAPLAGRRFRRGTLALDLTAGPALALQGNSAFDAPATATSPPVSWSTSPTAVRLLVGARLNLRARSVVRSFVGVDADLGLSHEADLPPSAPRLPGWCVGLSLGATVGTL